MSGDLSGFNVEQAERDAFTDMTGTHDAMIEKADFKSKTPGKSGYSIQVQILNGKFQNQRLFDYINWENPNETCQKIGRATVSSICRAVNVMDPKNFSELVGKPLKVVVKEGEDADGNRTNKIKKYMSRHAGPAKHTAANAAPPLQSEAAANEPVYASASANEDPF